MFLLVRRRNENGLRKKNKGLMKEVAITLSLKDWGKFQQVAMGGDNVKWETTGHPQETGQFG